MLRQCAFGQDLQEDTNLELLQRPFYNNNVVAFPLQFSWESPTQNRRSVLFDMCSKHVEGTAEVDHFMHKVNLGLAFRCKNSVRGTWNLVKYIECSHEIRNAWHIAAQHVHIRGLFEVFQTAQGRTKQCQDKGILPSHRDSPLPHPFVSILFIHPSMFILCHILSYSTDDHQVACKVFKHV